MGHGLMANGMQIQVGLQDNADSQLGRYLLFLDIIVHSQNR